MPFFQSGLNDNRRNFIFVAAICIIAIAVIRLVIESLQLVQYRLDYIFSWVNWLEIILFACSITFAFVFLNDCLCPFKWQWQIGALAVFLGWIDLIIFIQKFPLTGIYIVMFVDILYTFCRMIILSILLIAAFGLAFYMCFYDPNVRVCACTLHKYNLIRTHSDTYRCRKLIVILAMHIMHYGVCFYRTCLSHHLAWLF